MRTSIILGRKHDSDDVEVVAGPLPPDQANTKWKELVRRNGNGFAEIYLHELSLSAGRKRQNFPPPVKAKADAPAAKSDEAVGSEKDQTLGAEASTPKAFASGQSSALTHEEESAPSAPNNH